MSVSSHETSVDVHGMFCILGLVPYYRDQFGILDNRLRDAAPPGDEVGAGHGGCYEAAAQFRWSLYTLLLLLRTIQDSD